MNFTFVTHKGARPEKSELVKSHVMREAQKRRREAKQRRIRHPPVQESRLPVAFNDLILLPPAPGVPRDLDASHPFQPICSEDIELFPSSGAAKWIPEPWATSADDINSTDSTLVLDDFVGLWNAGQDPSPSGSQLMVTSPWLSIRLDDDHAFDPDTFMAAREISSFSSDGIYVGAHTVVPSLIPQPTPLAPPAVRDSSTSIDAWQSWDLIYRLNELIAHYITSYDYSLSATRVGIAAYWSSQPLVSLKILYSSALVYCIYRDVNREQPVDDHPYYKGQVIRMIHEAFKDPATAIDDDNLSAVLCVCMYENVSGSKHANTHLEGLRQMISLRGGINNLPVGKEQHFAEMSLLQDMLHAACSNVPPKLFDVAAPLLKGDGTVPEPSFRQSPLRIDMSYGVHVPPLELAKSHDVLRQAFRSLERLCMEAFDKERAATEEVLIEERRRHFWARLAPPAEKRALGDMTITERSDEAIRLAAKIHFRATALRIQYEDEVNVEDMKQLHSILRTTDWNFWKVAHYVYLWVLLTGGAASNGHEERHYFRSEILRMGLGPAMGDWRVFRQTMGNFLWIQHFLRQDVKEVGICEGVKG
ncbi:hypothetical protein B0J11DRAFT_265622 [Dendryphion nanum]|uniref:Uncharacterized protein n=1 Tax=Dendryphion nanum TaxID=256645 RepID=A0A9P9IPX7_9PLEO|nr:hypothetical protein B0J11DRAFT_265622 [Dendryphion nanum]